MAVYHENGFKTLPVSNLEKNKQAEKTMPYSHSVWGKGKRSVRWLASMLDTT